MATKSTKRPKETETKKAQKAANEAKASAAHAKATVAKEKARLAKERLAHGHAAGFMNFIREQGVIGLAVGLAVGAAAGDTVKKLVEGFITPIVQLLIGSQSKLEAATWQLEIAGRTGDFKWGAFVSSFITLAATALVIYLIIHFAKLDRLDRKKS
jgi:large conductance mechanosensitive channel